MQERPEVDYEALVEFALSGDVEEAERTLGRVLQQIPPRHRNTTARLQFAVGVVKFRKGQYDDACENHALANSHWTMAVSPELRAENLLAWFYAARIAARAKVFSRCLKRVLQSPSISKRQKIAALAAYIGGKRACKRLWPFGSAER